MAEMIYRYLSWSDWSKETSDEEQSNLEDQVRVQPAFKLERRLGYRVSVDNQDVFILRWRCCEDPSLFHSSPRGVVSRCGNLKNALG